MFGMLAMTALQMAPEIIKGFDQQSQNRSVLEFRNKQEEIRSSQNQAQMMQQARSSIGTARALLAGSGFGKGSTRRIVPQQSMINLESDLEFQRQHVEYMKSLGEMSKGPSMMSQIGSSMFKQFGVPAISRGLGGLFGGEPTGLNTLSSMGGLF